MVEGYLIGVRSFFNKWDHDNNYQFFLPEKGKILGYFKDKDLNFSKSGNKFYRNVNGEEYLKLCKKIKKKNFVKEIEIDDDLLLFLESAEKDLMNTQNKVNQKYKDLVSFFKWSKSQK